MKAEGLFFVCTLILCTLEGNLDGWGEGLVDPSKLNALDAFDRGIRIQPPEPKVPPPFLHTAEPSLTHDDPIANLPTMIQTQELPEGALHQILTSLPPNSFGSSYQLIASDKADDESSEITPLEEDYKKVLGDFKRIGCFPGRDKKVQMESIEATSQFGVRFAKANDTNPYSLCDEDVASELLTPLGMQNGTKTSIYNHFRDKIYQPLGFKVSPYRHSYADVLHDLIYLDDSMQTIQKTLPLPTVQDFGKIILGSFASISNYSADFDSNKDLISQMIMDILKQFHVFWNVARQKKQMSSTKVSTFAVLKRIIAKYRETSNAMRATTLTILDNVKDAYFRFVRASKLHSMIKSRPADIIVFQMLKRFDENARRIHESRSDQYSEVYELSVFLDLLRALFVTNYYQKRDSQQNRDYVQQNVVEKIQRIFKAYKSFMVANSDPALDRLKDFTATLLLKMQHRTFVIFSIYSLEGYISRPLFNYQSQFVGAVKLFYELTDRLMLVPGECQDLLSVKLELCARQKVFDVLTDLFNKYQLYASVGGAHTYRYAFDSLNDLIDDLKAKRVFDNFIFFRNYYFAELFKFSEVFRDQYKIQDMGVVNDLANAVGLLVEKFKAGSEQAEESAEAADLLDQDLYDFFLDIKSEFNKFAPLKGNPRQLQEIGSRFAERLDSFLRENKDKVGPDMQVVLDEARARAASWVGEHRAKFVVQVGSENAETPATQFIPLPLRDSEIMNTYISEPQINSGLMSPVAMPSPPSGG